MADILVCTFSILFHCPELTPCFVGEEYEEDEEELNRKCSDVKYPSRKRRVREAVDVKYDSEDGGEEPEAVERLRKWYSHSVRSGRCIYCLNGISLKPQ